MNLQQPHRPRPSNQDLANLARDGRAKADKDAGPMHLLIGVPLLLLSLWLFNLVFGFVGHSDPTAARGMGRLLLFALGAGYVALSLVVPALMRMLGWWNPSWNRFLPRLDGELAGFLRERTTRHRG